MDLTCQLEFVAIKIGRLLEVGRKTNPIINAADLFLCHLYPHINKIWDRDLVSLMHLTHFGCDPIRFRMLKVGVRYEGQANNGYSSQCGLFFNFVKFLPLLCCLYLPYKLRQSTSLFQTWQY